MIAWLDANQTAEKEEFEHQKKELEKVNLSLKQFFENSGLILDNLIKWFGIFDL